MAHDAHGAVVEVAGIGYRLALSTLSLGMLAQAGSEVTVFTIMQVRDDSISLFGFATQDERALFEKLVTVSGVGGKVALSALSVFSPSQLAALIAEGDVTRISSIPGIGKKTAQRIVLDLKGILALDEGEGLGGAAADGSHTSSAAKDAADALLGMGFNPTEISRALKGHEDLQDAHGHSIDAAALLRHALKHLGGS